MVERSGCSPNGRYMDNLFLNRMNSRQRPVKKEQESIFEKSISALYNLEISFKDVFRYAPVLSNDP